VSQLVTQPLDWLWFHRLALGKLAMLDGDPGLGKSLIALDLCARLSTGQPFPDGSPSPGPSSAIVLNAEDGEEDTIRPRLQALGADLDRVFVLPRTHAETGEALSFPAHLNVLDHALTQTRARLVVIDPLVAFLSPSVFESSNQSVRRALFPLAQLAQQHACVMELVRHLNKRGGSRSLYRGSGCMGLLGACRSGWLVARDPHDTGRCVLAQVKNNLAPAQSSLAYRVTPNGTGPPTLTWEGPTSWTADQLMAAASGAGPAPSLDRAREFLSRFLANGPRTSREVWEAASDQDLSDRTIERAKRDLAVRSVLVGAHGNRLSYWLLPGQTLPDTVPPEEVPPDLEPWLAPLRAQYPPSTPLDDL
jgi:hypothetical protein